MDKIEVGLHAHHAALREAAAASLTAQGAAGTANSARADQDAALQAPFAKVNSVVPGSPADAAGLRAGDEIVRFGNVNWMNHEKLSKVAEAVSQSEGVSRLNNAKVVEGRGPLTKLQRPLALQVSREGATPEVIDLQLTPRRNWGGRGLLGCHLLPL